ncbi:hypothetical protein F5I97DRAFT_1946467 [Phlebopus sp. FC_14]|nr:hypothetical protein F5I97DRAFT_1946467 [Phlebopus sp. FC_14]
MSVKSPMYALDRHASGRGRIASIHALPTEILSYVFELVTHGLSRDEQQVVGVGQQRLPFHPSCVTSPITLSAVNRRWRYVGLTTPTLWTSICVSIDRRPLGVPRDSALDAEGLACFLLRSRTCPIDILIDARDPEWEFPDFSDPLQSGSSATQHPFHLHLITQTLDILLHHVTRWRSLTILTDTWAPMHAAVTRLSRPPGPTASNHGGFPGDAMRGAACLETLTLMHCNEYIVQGDGFNMDGQGDDDDLKEGAILTPFAALFGYGRDAARDLNCHRLSRLRSLSLLGVPVNWARLSSLVGDTWMCGRGLSGESIQMLELSYLECRVRPRVADFCRMLRGCRSLRSLSLMRSELLQDEDEDEGASEGGHGQTQVDLQSLEKMHLAYDTVLDAIRILALLHCSNLKVLEMEQVVSPDSLASEDASLLLTYCSTGLLSKPKDLDATIESQKRRRPHFALLEELTLHHVTARDAGSCAVLFGCLPNLRRLTLRHTPVCAIASLLPRQIFCDGEDWCRVCAPCVRLTCLEVTHVDVRAYHLLGFTLKERGRIGAPPIGEVEFCLDVGSDGWLPTPAVGIDNSTYKEITHLRVVDE